MAKPVATLGDPGSHPGRIVTACARHRADNGQLIAREGDTFACLIHGPQPIRSAVSAKLMVEGAMAALDGSVAACGAVIRAGASSPEA
ncbi:PAAR domain-containing protein [Antarcticirhabdus aurantiaca]|uniref:PAAR domain-containing protein n=1 Tax=Antarcticirhabdus aurantiaca TaxID=2606717 RepID=UPI00131CFB83|nr:PAAR domain-containing protein [Antarcticirhabdus aurantiaca]